MKFPFKLPLLLDGATGSNLIARGLQTGACVEEWVIENSEIAAKLQQEFILAGSDVIYAPTFSANRAKLSQYNLEEKVEEFNKKIVENSKKTAAGKVLVAGDISPTGEFVEPFGDLTFLELIDIYFEQAKAQKAAGADLFAIETMMSLTEIRAAVIACKRCDLPIFVTVTVDEYGRTLTGATALSALISLQGMGIAAFGLNCSCGAEEMAEIIKELTPFSSIPIIAKPNAGQPDEDGNYGLSPKKMAEEMEKILENGATILGGCCGSTPEHIAEIRKVLDSFDFKKVSVEKQDLSLILANETQVFYLSADGIELSEKLTCSVDMADELLEISDTNIDAISVEILTQDDGYQFGLNAHMAKLPVIFSCDNEQALSAALMYYNGRAMVDKNSAIPEEILKKIADEYGAVTY
ncbi:MAG: homocysteine S-methyltransferase family protein [Oscillospiraceae bacterium]